mmetsp:Transcript_41495/g.103148  ORF Transcript_41495/g.103148 Transcript_41495/m.103148 type:complete len:305 (+) Transcript_41495:124-1038(+)
MVSQQYMDRNFDDTVEGGDTARPLIISAGQNSFWKRSEHVKNLTMPVVQLLRFFDSNLPTNGKVYKKMFRLVEELSELDSLPHAWAKKANELAAARWEYGHSVFHAAGYALDPEFQRELSATGLDDPGLMAVKQGLRKVVQRLSLRAELMEVQPELKRAVDEMPTLAIEISCTKVAQRVADFFLEYNQYLSPTGPMAEEDVQINAKRMPPAEFWSLHLGHLTKTAHIAKSILGHVACASQAERNWKAYGRIKTPSRAKLMHEKADMRVYLYNVLQQNHRLQDANFIPEVIEWDDVSSDETADEA